MNSWFAKIGMQTKSKLVQMIAFAVHFEYEMLSLLYCVCVKICLDKTISSEHEQCPTKRTYAHSLRAPAIRYKTVFFLRNSETRAQPI